MTDCAHRRERGAVTVLALMLFVVAMLLVLGVTRVGIALHDRARADTAADAGALAAVEEIALGHGEVAARDAASAMVALNGATLMSYELRGRFATVETRVGRMRARARAEVVARGLRVGG